MMMEILIINKKRMLIKKKKPEPDEGERLSCVLRRVLIAPKGDNSHQQRPTLFKTRCTIQNKVYNMIIIVPAEKIVSKKLVSALNLKTEPHLNPYKIDWIKKGEMHR